MRQGSFKRLMLAMLLGHYLDGMTRTEGRQHVKSVMRKSRSKKIYKPIKGMPTLGQIVIATTKYGKTHKCEYQHARFLPLGKPYSFSIYEITSWSSK